MSIYVSSSLKLIVEEIKNTCQRRSLLNRFEFKELLATTNGIERYLIKKKFCQLPWEIGSVRVLAVLQELRILTATELILILDSNEQIQCALNDFLEAEYELLANLFITASYDAEYSTTIGAILDECLLALFTDILQNPDLNDFTYLDSLKSQLPSNVLSKMTLKHVDTILQLHKSNVKTAYANFSTWINEGVDTLTFTKKLQKTLICNMEQEILKYLFRISSQETFKEWKFYLILLQTIACNCKAETTTYIRKYLKDRVREIVARLNKQLVLHMLLTARALTATTMDIQKNVNSYAEWYRQNIAEMKFILKAEEFQNVCMLLEQCIAYEMEEDYLEVHATISISPPVLCGKLVQGYKNKCKLRLSQIKSNDMDDPENGDKSILIDSD